MLVAIIGLVGVVVASTAFSEWFRRRDQRNAIKVDLELWEKLPAGDTKDGLLKSIEKRVGELADDDGGPSLPKGKLVFAGFMMLVCFGFIGLSVYSSGWHLARSSAGVMQVRGAAFAMDLAPFVLAAFVMILGSMFAGGYSYRLWGRYRRFRPHNR